MGLQLKFIDSAKSQLLVACIQEPTINRRDNANGERMAVPYHHLPNPDLQLAQIEASRLVSLARFLAHGYRSSGAGYAFPVTEAGLPHLSRLK